MTTLSILKLDPGQKIPRPFNRASSIGEAAEVIWNWQAVTEHRSRSDRATGAAMANESPEEIIEVASIGSESPVFQHRNGTKFYVFPEA